MKRENLLHLGVWLSTLTLILLPWQTRYIFWRPWIGTTESEFGVVSLYATMVFAGMGVLSFFFYDAGRVRKETSGKAIKIAGMAVLASFVVFAWGRSYPSVVHAWILNALFAVLVGYLSYRLAKEKAHAPLKALLLGLIAPFLLGIWQVCAGFSPESTVLGLATRNAAQLGDAVFVFGGTRILRMYGSFPHPNIFGTVLALCYAGVVSVFIDEKKKRMFFLVASALMVIVAFGISRSAALAMLCASLIGLVRTASHKKVFFSLIAAIPPFIWIMQFFAPELLAIRGTSSIEMQSLTERVQQINDWKDMMSNGGIVGVGIYGYPEALAERSEVVKAAWTYQPVHNIFLLMLAELGVWWSAFFALVMARGMWIFKERAVRMAPLFVTLWSLAWFDHALWTSWAGMAYTAVCFGSFLGIKEDVSTLS